MSKNSPNRMVLAILLALAMFAAGCGDSDGGDSAATDADSTETSDNAAADDGAAADGEVAADGDEAAADDDEAAADDDEAAADDDEAAADDDEAADESASDPVDGPQTAALDVGLFFDGSIEGDVATEACTLSGGAETECYVFTVAGDPVSYDTGPFCPSTIEDSAEEGGIWFDGNGVYNVDGEFIVGLAELYDDDNWLLYDEDGNVNVTETAEEFDLAARPDVDESLQNHCVAGSVEFLENGEPVTSTVTIPVEPVLADASTSARGNLGVTLDGVVIAASAPVDAILGAYTIAAFDDCGGHYNPTEGYHLHGATGCSELESDIEGETPMFAYAMDGFPVHSPIEDTSDLDECNGHETEELGYHYHANSAEENLVVQCFIGQTVAGADGGGGGRGPRPE